MEGPDHEDLAITVLTCKGDLSDPRFPFILNQLVSKLKKLVSNDKTPFLVTKIEPWNSVRVTFYISKEAAQRLRLLAERRDDQLRDLGVLSVQVEGDQITTPIFANNFNQSQNMLVNNKNDEATSSSSSSPSLSQDLSAIRSLPTTSATVKATSSLSSSFDSNSLSSSDGMLSSSVGSLNSSATTTPVSVCGLNIDTSNRNMAQYLSQQSSLINLDGENSSFKSPNVIAPKSEDPLPFIHSSTAPYSPSASSTTSQFPLSASTSASSTTGSLPCNNVCPNKANVNIPTTRPVQSNVAPFPFASMQYAMQTAKQGSSLATSAAGSVQPPIKSNLNQPNRLPLVNITSSHGVLSPKLIPTSTQNLPSTIISPLPPTTSSTVSSLNNSNSTTPPPNLVVSSTPPPLSPSTFIRNPGSFSAIRVSKQQVIFNEKSNSLGSSQSQPSSTINSPSISFSSSSPSTSPLSTVAIKSWGCKEPQRESVASDQPLVEQVCKTIMQTVVSEPSSQQRNCSRENLHNAISSASSNVALTSPLLVNLLQSDGSPKNNPKMMPPPPPPPPSSSSSSTQPSKIKTGSGELPAKTKQRKPRKVKDKPPDNESVRQTQHYLPLQNQSSKGFSLLHNNSSPSSIDSAKFSPSPINISSLAHTSTASAIPSVLTGHETDPQPSNNLANIHSSTQISSNSTVNLSQSTNLVRQKTDRIHIPDGSVPNYPAGQTEVQGPSHVQKFSQNLPSKTHTMPQQRINNIVGSPSATSRQSFFSSSSDNDSSLGLNPHETVTFSIGDLQITKQILPRPDQQTTFSLLHSQPSCHTQQRPSKTDICSLPIDKVHLSSASESSTQVITQNPEERQEKPESYASQGQGYVNNESTIIATSNFSSSDNTEKQLQSSSSPNISNLISPESSQYESAPLKSTEKLQSESKNTCEEMTIFGTLSSSTTDSSMKEHLNNPKTNQVELLGKNDQNIKGWFESTSELKSVSSKVKSLEVSTPQVMSTVSSESSKPTESAATTATSLNALCVEKDSISYGSHSLVSSSTSVPFTNEFLGTNRLLDILIPPPVNSSDLDQICEDDPPPELFKSTEDGNRDLSSNSDSGIGKCVNDASSSSSEVSNPERTPPSEIVPCLNNISGNSHDQAPVEVEISNLEMVDLTIKCEGDSVLDVEELSLPKVMSDESYPLQNVIIDSESIEEKRGNSVTDGDHNYFTQITPKNLSSQDSMHLNMVGENKEKRRKINKSSTTILLQDRKINRWNLRSRRKRKIINKERHKNDDNIAGKGNK